MTNLSRRRFLGQIGGASLVLPLLSMLDACGDDDSDSSSSSPATTASPASVPATTGSPPASVPESLGTVQYQLSWLKDAQWTGEYQADSVGYWTDLGLTVNMLAGGAEIDPTAVVVAGQAITGPADSGPIAGAITAGADLKIVATKYQKSPFAIVSRSVAPIATVADMVGKTIGVSEFTTVTFETFLSLNGIDPADVNTVPYNFDPSPLISGDVDGLFGYANDEPISLEQQGVDATVLLLSDNGYDVIANAYAVNTTTLTDPHPRAQLVALLAGIVKGWRDVIADPEGLTPPLLSTYASELEIEPAHGIAIVEATSKLMVGDGAVDGIYRLTPDRIASTVSVLAKEGTQMDASAFDLTVMDEVYALIG